MRTTQHDEVSTTLWLIAKRETENALTYVNEKNVVMAEHKLHEALHIVGKLLEIEDAAATKWVDEQEDPNHQ